MSRKAIKVSQPVYDELMEIKREYKHTSLDSVIRELIHCYNFHYRKKEV